MKVQLGILMTLALLALGGFYWYKYGKETPSIFTSSEVRTDLVKLADNDPSEYKSVILGQALSGDNDALKTALKLLSHKNAVVRSASAEAIGLYPETKENLDVLTDLLYKDERIVRIGVVRGFSKNPTEGRRRVVLQLLDQEEISLDEKIELFTALGKSNDKESVNSAVEWLLYLGNQNNNQLNFTAISRAANISPRDPRLIQSLHRKLDENANIGEVKLSIQHLASIKDEEFGTKLSKLLKDEQEDVRASAVMALSRLCPENRWTTLRSLKDSDKSTRVQMAIVQTALEMRGAESKTFVEDMLDNQPLPKSFIEEYKSKLKEYVDRRYKGSCRSK